MPQSAEAAPSITLQPVSAVVAPGQSTSLSVTAADAAPIRYQWLKDGVILTGQTNATLTYSSFQFTNSGCYAVVLTNASGMSISFPASLSASNAPLKAWGKNDYGQLGTGNTNNSSLPLSVSSNVVAMAAGDGHSLFVKADGTLWGMGRNDHGQLGTGNNTDTNRPVSVASNVVAVAAGDYHSLFLKADGTLWVMGYNYYTQLGTGNNTDAHQPVNVASNVVSVAAGNNHSLFVKADGTLWAMGGNTFGQLGTGNNDSSSFPVSVASNVVAVAGGWYFSLFMKADGTLLAMGRNDYGQLGNGSNTDTNLPVRVASNVVAVAAGSYHSLFVKADSTLWAVGQNTYGQLGNGNTTHTNRPVSVASNVVAVAAGRNYSLLMKADGALWAMGNNESGQLGNGSTTSTNRPVNVAGLTVASLGAIGQADQSLAVAAAPPQAASLANQIVTLWDGFTFFSVVTGGDGPFTYQWQLKGTNISGATQAIYSKASAALSDGGTYTITVTGLSGSATRSVNLTVRVNPTITAVPTASAITYGQTLADSTLSGGSTSVPGIFAWFEPTKVLPKGTALLGALSFTPTDTTNYTTLTTATFVVVNPRPVMLTGTRIYDGTATADAAILSVSNTVGSDHVTVASGTATLAGVMIGAQTITGSGTLALGGSNSTNYTLTGVTGSVTIIDGKPVITTQPVSQVVTPGQPASLAVTNTALSAYQWFKDGVRLTGQTNSTLSISSFQFTNSGCYSVVMTNAAGMAISFPARLSIPNAPLKTWGYNEFGQLGNGSLFANQPQTVASDVVAVAAGYTHSLFVKADGTLWSMGYNWDGELGNGNNFDTRLPVSVTTNVVAVAAGSYHSLLVKADGTLWAMGYNGYGQFGNGTTVNANRPASVTSNVVAVAAGGNHTLFVKADGTLWAMGNNDCGQLGNGSTVKTNRPVNVASNVVAVAAGGNHTLFVKADGTLWAMGNNNKGQLGNGTTNNSSQPLTVASNVVAVAGGGNHTLFVKADGTLWAMGNNDSGQLGNGNNISTNRPVNVTSNVVAVAAGDYRSLFVKADGMLWGMGDNSSGQLGKGTADSNLPVSVADFGVASLGAISMANHSLAVAVTTPQSPSLVNQTITVGEPFTFSLVDANGDGPFTYQWQHNGTNITGATHASYTVANAALTDTGTYVAVVVASLYGNTTRASATLTVNRPPNPPIITAQPMGAIVARGQSANLSVVARLTDTNGAASPFGYQWLKDGALLPGQTNSTLNISSFQFIDSGNYSVVITNVYGLAISFPASLSVPNAPLKAWGKNGDGQLGIGSNNTNQPVSVTSNVLAVAGGGSHSLFIKADGTLWAMGYNRDGQLGNGSTASTSLPVSVTSNVVAVAAGSYHSLFVKADGTLWSMGSNDGGRLGNGNNISTNRPVSVASNVVAVAGGGSHSLFVKSDGTLWVMGSNWEGQLGNGNNTDTNRPVSVASNVVAVAGGFYYSLFMKADGTLWAMGSNNDGQFGNGNNSNNNSPVKVASNVVAVAAGSYHALFVKADGTLWSMGYNGYGQLGNGCNTNTNQPVSVASNVVAVAGGFYYSLFVKADGTLWSMGENDSGQLGNGNTTRTNLPVRVANVTVASLGAMNSAHHSLAVAAATPEAAPLTNQSVRVGHPFTFSLDVVNGDGPFTYQWQHNGTNIVNATQASYTVASAAFTDAGNYAIVVASPYGITTWSASLRVLVIPTITTWPTASTLIYGQTLAESTLSGGSASVPGSFDWTTSASVPPAGTPSPSVTFTPEDPTTYATVTAAVSVLVNPRPAVLTGIRLYDGTANAAAAILTVANALAGDTVTVVSGTATLADAMLGVQAITGLGTLALGGSSSANYTLAGATGSVTIADGQPGMTTQPMSQVVTRGQPTSLSVTHTGYSVAYQWFKDGVRLSGQTNRTISFASFQFTDSGNYSVVITNSYGMGISFPARLSLPNAPLKAWGYNAFGQLGIGNKNNTQQPTSVTSNVVAVAAGNLHSLFVKNDGTLWAMGYNNYGQLGTGNTTATNWPVSVASNVVAVAAGDTHSLFLKADGTLWAMGYNNYGQLGNGTTVNTSRPVSVASNVVAMAAGDAHSLFVKADGTLWSMGYNYSGQLGNGTFYGSISVPVNVDSNVVSVAAGDAHSLFVKTDGTLWAMGYNNVGQLGTGNTTDANQPVNVDSNVVAVAAGYLHSLFVKADGTMWAMGYNNVGQLGTGCNTDTNRPVHVASNVVAVTAGHVHSLFVKTDSTLWAMGCNDDGQLGSGNTTSTNLPVCVANLTVASLDAMGQARHSLAVVAIAPQINSLTNQTITEGQPFTFNLVFTEGDGPFTCQWKLNGTNIVAATQDSYTVASAEVTDAGTYTVLVVGIVGSATQSVHLAVRGLPSITAWPTPSTLSYGQTVAESLLSGGSASVPGNFTWTTSTHVPPAGTPSPTVTFTPEDTTTYAEVTAAVSVHVNPRPVVLTGSRLYDGTANAAAAILTVANALAGDTVTVVSGTATLAGALAGVQTITDLGTLALGGSSSANYTLTGATGSVTITDGKPGVTTQPVSQVVTLGQPASLSVTNTGYSVAYQWFKDGVRLSGQTNRTISFSSFQFADSGNYSVVITNSYGMAISFPARLSLPNAPLKTWGNNNSGQLGNGTSLNTNRPVSVASHVVAVAAGSSHSLFVKADGTLWAMGYNSDGRLGIGNNTDTNRPVNVASNAVVVAAGYAHSLFANADGTLWAMGYNNFGALGNGNWTNTNRPVNVASNVVAVAAGGFHSLFMKSDGTLWAMGHNDYGQLGNGNNTRTNRPVNVASNVVAVAAGAYHSLFVKADGTLWATGYNNIGQLGIGNNTAARLPVRVASNVVAVAAGDLHSLFVKSDGTLWAMGNSTYGQLGNGSTSTSLPVSVASNVVAVAAGYDHSLFAKADGTLWAMGYNSSGQLGNGSTSNTNLPVRVAGLTVASLGAMNQAYHSLAVAVAVPQDANLANQASPVGQPFEFNLDVTNSDGPFTYQWQLNGTNIVDATNVSYTVASAAFTDAGTYAVVVSSLYGITTTCRANLIVQAIPTITTCPAASAITYGQTLAESALSGGSASVPGSFTWTTSTSVLPAGTPSSDVTFTPADTTNYTTVTSAGTVGVLVNPRPVVLTGTRLYDGTVDVTAAILSVSNTVGSDTVTVVSGTALLASALGGAQAITDIGTLVLGGSSSANYTLADGTGAVTITYVNPVITTQPTSQVVTPGQFASLSVTNTGDFVTYQWLKDGAMLTGQTNSTINFESFQFTDSGSYQVVIANTTWVVVSMPAWVGVPNAPLKTWGNNNSGQLGNGSTSNTNRPVSVASNVVAVASGYAHSLFSKADGTLWAMGYNYNGQLGNGCNTDTNRPMSVVSNVVAVAAGTYHSLFVKADGTLWAMGSNNYGQLGNGCNADTNRPVSVASNVVAVASGYAHSLFAKADGTLWAMGYNNDGQLGNGCNTYTNRPVSVASNVVAVAAGGDHSLFVKADGTLWAMGYNNYGQLGNGSTSTNRPVCVASNVVAVAAGNSHSLFVKADGTLWAMGYNNYGQLGNGSTSNTNWPVRVASNVVAVAAGYFHSLFAKSDGTLWTMGYNYFGQLGIGNTSNTNRPVRVAGLTVASLGAMDRANHSLAVAVAVPQATSLTNQSVPVGQPFTFSLDAANSDGPFTYQWQFNGTPIVDATNVSYTVASAALTDAGTYTVVISSLYGITATGNANLIVQAIPAIAAWPVASAITYGQTLAESVLSGGSVSVPGSFAWTASAAMLPAGTPSMDITFTPADTTNNIPVAGTVGVLVNPRPVVLTGTRLYDGTVDVTATILSVSNTVGSDTVTVVSGTATLASALGGPQSITGMGTLVLAGSSSANYTLTGGTGSVTITYVKPVITTQPTSQVVTPGQFASLSVTNTGDFVTYQWLKDGTKLLGQTNSTISFASFQFTDSGSYQVVIRNTTWMVISIPAWIGVPNAPLKTWGNNEAGQLGNGSISNTNRPVSVASNVAAVAAGYFHSLFAKADGTLWTMGYNNYGQLGNGNKNQANQPVSVASNVVAVAGGTYHSLFLKADGTLWAMGNNGDGELGNGTTTTTNRPVSVASNVVAVAAGQYHSLFLKADGTLWAMGYNTSGQLGDGTTTQRKSPVAVVGGSNVVAVAAGQYHSLFVKADGTLWAMGYNNYGQLGNESTADTYRPVSVASNVVAVAAGYNHSLFVKDDGTLWAMGYNNYGQLGTGNTTATNWPVSVASNVVAVAGGSYHSLFVKADGTLWTMGYNNRGQLGIGTTTTTNRPVRVAGLIVASLGAMDCASHSLAVAVAVPQAVSLTNQAITVGRPFAFSLNAANSDGPFTYQWQLNGTNIVDATNVSYTAVSSAVTDAGIYAVVVASPYSIATSASATLTVNRVTPSVIDWPTASDIIWDQTLANSTLSGGRASVDGTFAWTTPATVPDAGTALQSVTFTPADAVNYNAVTGTANVSVLVATEPTVSTLAASALLSGGATLQAAINPNGRPTDLFFQYSTTTNFSDETIITVSTLAGASFRYVDGTGTSAQFNKPSGVAVDASGTVYVADNQNNCIRKVTAAGVTTTLAGATKGYAEGTGTAAQFDNPQGVAVDASGTVYVADTGNNCIRKVTAAGVVTTLAGSSWGYTEGAGAEAQFAKPSGVAVDADGTVYVADTDNNCIRKITAAGEVTTLAGASWGYADGTDTEAKFNNPSDVAVDATGTVYVADKGNNRIRKVTAAGVVTTLAGSGAYNYGDGTGTAAHFYFPSGVTVDADGTVYVADSQNNRIRKITAAGVVTTLAGTSWGNYADGTGTAAQFKEPYRVAVDASGKVYVADFNNNCIRQVTATGVVSTLAGSPYSNADGTGAAAYFNNPQGMAVDISGTVYAADAGNHRIRRITAAGVVTTLAGATLGSVDGSGAAAQFNTPQGVAVNASGKVYVADMGNNCIRKVTAAGVVTTLAGASGYYGYVDGSSAEAQFANPSSVAVDASGTVYVADSQNNCIRKVTTTGVVSTLAGSNGGGYADGSGAEALFANPTGVAVDADGTVYVADSQNNCIRKVTTAGVTTTLAGSFPGYVDGTGTEAQFNNPSGVAVDTRGNVYVADQNNNCIRKVTAAGVVTTLAGSTLGYADGTGVEAQFANPTGVAVDANGTVYVADQGNSRIRKITSSSVTSLLVQSGITGMDSVNVSLSVNGLMSQTTYYYRTLATNSLGSITSQTLNFTTLTNIAPASSTLELASSLNPSSLGADVTLTATVSPNTATGSILFLDGANTLGVATLSSGVATFTTHSLSASSHSLTALYMGDGLYDESASNPLIQVVRQASQSITFAALPVMVFGDAPFDLTASASSGLPVSYDSSDKAVATVVGNTVSILKVGSTLLTASQAGDDNYLAATNVSQNLLVDELLLGLSIHMKTNAAILTITGNLGREYIIRYKDALTNADWSVLTTITSLPFSPYTFTNQTSVLQPTRFYRLRRSDK